MVKRGSTSNMVRVFIQDNTSTKGAGLAGLTFESINLQIAVIRELSATPVIYTGANIETITTIGTFQAPSTSAKCRFKAVDGTNTPGVYEIHFHDDAGHFGAGDASKKLQIYIFEITTTALNIAPCLREIQLIAYDPQDAVRLGLTALPNAAADAAGGLPISDAGGLDMDGLSSFDPASEEVDIGAVKGTGVTSVDDFKTTGFSTHSAADVVTAMQDTGTKLTAIHGKLPSKDYFTGTANSDGDIEMGDATGNFPGTVGKSPTTLAAADVSGNLPAEVKAEDNIDFGALKKASLSAATPAVTVSDKTGFALTSAYDPAKTAAQASVLATVAGYIDTEIQAIIDTLGHGTYGLSALNTDLDALLARLTALRAGYIDNLSAGAVALQATLENATYGLAALLAAIEAGGGITAQEVRDALKLAPTAGDPAAGSVDKHLDDLDTKALTLQTTLTGSIAQGAVQRRVVLKDTRVIETIRGDAWEIPFTLGAAENWTGKKVYFCAKKVQTADNSTAIVNREITVTDAVNRIGSITLTDDENAVVDVYFCELEVRDDSDPDFVRTDYQGKLKICQDVRQ